jgi:hypothetical protein
MVTGIAKLMLEVFQQYDRPISNKELEFIMKDKIRISSLSSTRSKLVRTGFLVEIPPKIVNGVKVREWIFKKSKTNHVAVLSDKLSRIEEQVENILRKVKE